MTEDDHSSSPETSGPPSAGPSRRLVFISHASKDFALADEVRELLEARGVRCWIAPRDIPGTQRYFEEIVEGIRECAVTLLLLTPQANASDAVALEIERSFAYQKPILPLRLRNIRPSAKLEFIVSSCQWVDAFDTPLKRRVDAIVAIVLAIERGERPPAPAPEHKTWGGRIERWLEQVLRHRLLAAAGAFGVLVAVVALAWHDTHSLVKARSDEQATIDQDPSTLGLVKLSAKDAAGTAATDGRDELWGAAYLNAKGSTFEQVNLHATPWTGSTAGALLDLTPLVRQGGAVDAQTFTFPVPPGTTRVTVCLSVPHPHLHEVYSALWSYRLDHRNGALTLSQDAAPALRRGLPDGCGS